ncbi:hypothetical protein OPV22_004715 [Ensete ventricosum]|uniref:Uncharacterized protein n=1 Tax=Ensete ventricosum TaxID=4639 RepID=A0AAV8RJE9_ENSVE|nr:hypothetical protein OPV22_004715 [Ensete ventricosum]
MAARFRLAGGIPESRVRRIRDADDSRESTASLKLATGLVALLPPIISLCLANKDVICLFLVSLVFVFI